MSSLSYFMYRGSLKSSYVMWARITFKHWLLFTEYPNVMYFYGMTEESDRKNLCRYSFRVKFQQ